MNTAAESVQVAGAASPAPDPAYTHFLAALVSGDRAQCRKIFEAWLADGSDLRLLYQERLQRALYEIGTLWESGRISVATEHLASAIAEGLLNLVTPRLLGLPKVGKSAVVTCGANEYHQIGGRMVADFFELNGWRAHFLGANTPDEALLALLRDKHPDAVALSLALYFNLESLLRTVRAIREAYPSLPILVGGQAFREGGRERVEQIEGVHFLASLGDLEIWLEQEAQRVR